MSDHMRQGHPGHQAWLRANPGVRLNVSAHGSPITLPPWGTWPCRRRGALCACAFVWGLGKEPTSFPSQGRPALYQVLPVCRSKTACFVPTERVGYAPASISPGEGTAWSPSQNPSFFQSTTRSCRMAFTEHRAGPVHLPSASQDRRRGGQTPSADGQWEEGGSLYSEAATQAAFGSCLMSVTLTLCH